ncbi:MAG: hypothetical protein IT457_23130 [Planctomycetes bacterium]|nr:hypothetical protein [Planctomycetota bacterium]
MPSAPRLARLAAFTLLVAAASVQAPLAAQDGGVQHPALLGVDDRSRIAFAERGHEVAFALYTVQDGVLKLSAQLFPLRAEDEHRVVLEIRDGEDWREIASAEVHAVGWTACLRVHGWDATSAVRYRVRHAGGGTFEGVVRADPRARDAIVAAVFTGNSPGPGGGRLDKRDVVDAVAALDPDVLLFTGDQVYDHFTHTAAWLEFGTTFADLIRERPTVCLPDDHDVGQGNLWGQGGRRIDLDSKGGYVRPAGYVKLVERQQTSHLPDPVDPAPIEQGIATYFTRLVVGGIDFALIEDRKFKSGCFGLVPPELGPRPDHVDRPDYDPRAFDVPGLQLLGERQERFLTRWGEDWDGIAMKTVVSQTLFAMASNYHSKDRTFYHCDFDANGWPQTARDRAVELLRRASAFHVCGDQHLATIVQYGIEDWRDAGFAFCVPSIANLWPRWWAPKTEGRNREPGADANTGDHLDGFGNRLTVYAHTNPRETGREPKELHDRMPGFGILRFAKRARTITMECWPRRMDPRAADARQYDGWPRTIGQLELLGRQPFELPELVVGNGVDPIVQVIASGAGPLFCTLRIAGDRVRVPVPGAGPYDVLLRAGGKTARLEGIRALPRGSTADPLRVELR